MTKKIVRKMLKRSINNLAIPVTVTAHLVCALYYLSIPQEVKETPGKLDFFALWFFGSEFMVFIPIMLYLTTYINPKSELDTDLINIEIGHILLRGVIYSLHYSGLVHTDSRHRLVFFLGYVFLQCINLIRKAACK